MSKSTNVQRYNCPKVQMSLSSNDQWFKCQMVKCQKVQVQISKSSSSSIKKFNCISVRLSKSPNVPNSKCLIVQCPKIKTLKCPNVPLSHCPAVQSPCEQIYKSTKAHNLYRISFYLYFLILQICK